MDSFDNFIANPCRYPAAQN